MIRHDATVDKLIGDEVMAFFVPGFAGPDFKRSSVRAGLALLRKLGHGGEREPWLPVGVGVDAGVAFVGNVGGEDFVDFTVLGDPVNTAARIQAAQSPASCWSASRHSQPLPINILTASPTGWCLEEKKLRSVFTPYH